MAGNGPPPNPNRRRANADEFPHREIVADGQVRGPDLDGDHHPATVTWWETWRRSAQAAAFLDTDWQRLRMVAELMDQFWERPTERTLGEIRLNEGLLGATHTDRLKGRLDVRQPESKPTPDRPANDRKARLLRAVGDA